jgi:D-beta-D-heptose 7-phosphate kinase/D-beta-D-heptose 1-phosphate adenosyltransferase
MIHDLHWVIQLIERDWREVRVIVVGDVMLDRYIWGEVERISPEAPVPVVRSIHRSEQPGGAANVAMNVAGLGAKASLFGFCAADADGECLRACLAKAGIDSDLTVVASHPTTSKLRILGGSQQMLRLDTEETSSYSDSAYEDLSAKVEAALSSGGILVLSDYAKGVLSEPVCRRLIQRARALGVPVLIDPKQRDFARYRGATTICPNLHELSTATGVPAKDLEGVLAAGQRLISALELESITVTLSEKGIAVLFPHSQTMSPAAARQVFDISGAGDTVIATLALTRACNLDTGTALAVANMAAGIVVGKVGTVPVSRDELIASLMPELELNAREKVLDLGQLKTRTSAWRASGKKIAFTNGCFDLLHIGHITLLEQARREADRLVVAINSDASVRNLKGRGRPVVGGNERARILAAMFAVDAVVIFDAPTPIAVIEALRPDVIVKGGDYDESTVVGAKEVRSWGGRVKIVPTVEGFSTTNLIAKAASPSLQ